MLLQELKALADRLDKGIPTGGYGPLRIAWAVILDHDGKLLGMTDLREGIKGPDAQGKEFLVPDYKRSVDITPRLLVDNGEYALGIKPEDESAENTIRRHAAFCKIVEECLTATAEPTVAAVQRFLGDLPGSLQGLLPAEFSPGSFVMFQVLVGDELVIPTDLPSVRAFWAEWSRKRRENTTAGEMTCLVCGNSGPVVGILPVDIKGVPGGQPSGLTLTSANSDNFESYGLKKSTVAPICFQCAESTHRLLNDILAGRTGARYIVRGQRAYVAWTKGEPFNAYENAAYARPEDVSEILRAVWSGRKGAALLDTTPYFAAPLSANLKRLVIRGWLHTTVGEVKSRLSDFFTAQGVTLERIERGDRPLGVFALAKGLQRTGDDGELPGNVVDVLFNHALYGHPLPAQLLSKAVQRCRRERATSRARVTLIRLSLKQGGRISDMEQSRAFQCGRLFAVFDQIQHAVNPDINATIVDRYFSKASMAPAAVFPQLFRLAEKHLAFLRKSKRRYGTYVHLSKLLDGLAVKAGPFPQVMNLEDQGLFMMGFHEQREARFTKSEGGPAEDPIEAPEMEEEDD